MSSPAFLRSDALAGRVVALARAGEDGDGALATALAASGADVRTLDLGGDLDEAAAEAWAAAQTDVTALVVDAAGSFGDGGADALRAAIDSAWLPIRALANAALIPAARGAIVLVAPSSGAGPYAHAAQAGLENLARTLSTEWARHGVTITAVAPGPHATPDRAAELVAFLLSPAGEYFTGCRLDLGGTLG